MKLTYIDDEIYTQVPKGTEASASQRQSQRWKWFDGCWWVPAKPVFSKPLSISDEQINGMVEDLNRKAEKIRDDFRKISDMPRMSDDVANLSFADTIYNSGYALTPRERQIARYFWGKANDCP